LRPCPHGGNTNAIQIHAELGCRYGRPALYGGAESVAGASASASHFGHRRPSHFPSGRRHGGSGRYRQEAGRKDLGQRDDRRSGPLQLPGRPTGAGPVCAHHSRRRLRSQRQVDRRRHAAEDRHGGSQARQNEKPLAPAFQRRMDDELPRERGAEVVPAELRGLPHARADRSCDARRRRMDPGHPPDAGLCGGEPADQGNGSRIRNGPGGRSSIADRPNTSPPST